jgi:transposase
MNELFWLNDRQWANVEPLLPKNVQGKRHVDDRRVISGIIHVMRSGRQWSETPEVYGPSKVLYGYFIHWSLTGIWEEVFAALAATGGPPAEDLLDSTHTKVHLCPRPKNRMPYDVRFARAASC